LRFELQIEAMRMHPRITVIGSRLRLFPRDAFGAGMRRWADWHNGLLTHEAMANEMLIDSPLAHGTAMIRTRWLERVGGWSERGWAEDLDLWVRLLDAGARFAKLPRVLYGWRQHRGSATRRDPRYARERFLDLKRAALERGLLRGAPGLTLIGVGESLARWRAALATGRRLRVIEARRPSPSSLTSLVPPVVLVFLSPRARDRWRTALQHSGIAERHEFIFVA
jgi:GT2 family glycosyltransferase